MVARQEATAGWPDNADSMIARTVWRQRPQSEPAPQAAATCLDVHAPLATASATQ
jgi:hypothetical protein